MITITRENAEIKSFITGFLSDPAHDNQSTDSLLANVFRIAQASLEAEPMAWRYRYVKKSITDSQGSRGLVTGNMYRQKRIATTDRTMKFRRYSLPRLCH